MVNKKEALMAKIEHEKTQLTSNPQFADLLREYGVEPPIKISPITGKEDHEQGRPGHLRAPRILLGSGPANHLTIRKGEQTMEQTLLGLLAISLLIVSGVCAWICTLDVPPWMIAIQGTWSVMTGLTGLMTALMMIL